MKSKTNTASYYAVRKGKIKIALKMHLHLLLAAAAVYVLLLLLVFFWKYGDGVLIMLNMFMLAVLTGKIVDAEMLTVLMQGFTILAVEFFYIALYTLPALLLYPALLLVYKRKAQKAEREEKQRLEKESRRPTVKDLF
jgi:K+-sensing histidine kinase KdpD